MTEQADPERTKRSEMRETLRRPFDRQGGEVKSRRGGGGRMLDYVATPTVINRIEEATGGVWDFELEWPPVIVDTYEKEVINQQTGEKKGGKDSPVKTLVVGGHLTIPGLGRRGAMGVANIVEGAGEDNLKGAASDALKKAATLFGVALHLYEDDVPPVGARREATANGEQRYQRADQTDTSVTDRQRKLFEELVNELDLSVPQVDKIAKDASGYGLQGLNKFGMSKTINALQELKKKRAADSEGEESYPQDDGGAPAGNPKDTWLRNIKNASSSKQLVAVYEGVKGAKLDGDGEVRAAMRDKWELAIANAGTSKALDTIFDALQATGFDQDEALLTAMSDREGILQQG